MTATTDHQLQIREMALRVRIYKILALAFFAAGFILVIFMYYLQSDGGDPMTFFGKPSSIVLVILPFMPAIVFSRSMFSSDKKLKKLLEESNPAAQTGKV